MVGLSQKKTNLICSKNSLTKIVGYHQPTCLFIQDSIRRWNQLRMQKIFMRGGFIQCHMVAICIWCALFVTSQFDVIFMFSNQRFGKDCWHNAHIRLHALPVICVIELTVNYQRFQLGYRRNIHSTLRHSSS